MGQYLKACNILADAASTFSITREVLITYAVCCFFFPQCLQADLKKTHTKILMRVLILSHSSE